MKKNSFLKYEKRHRVIYRTVLFLTKKYFIRKYNLSYDDFVRMEGPTLYIANHTTDADFWLLTLMLGEHTYIVGADNLLRNRLLGKLITFLAHPIFIHKGILDIKTVSNICNVIKAGKDVMLFPEGNRSFDGLTVEIPPATAKLVKSMHCNLVLLRIEGGFLSQPRFAKNTRRGRKHISLVEKLTANQVKDLDVLTLTDIINRSIAENAYERQQEDRALYKGRRLAEGIETTLFCCPSCKKMQSLFSKGNQVECTCGYKLTYMESGELIDSEGKTHRLYEFNHIQREELEHRMNQPSELIFTDDVSVREVIDYRYGKKVHGVIKAYSDKLEWGTSGDNHIIDFKEINSVAIFKRNILSVNLESGAQYEINGNESFSALKYSYYFKYMSRREI